MSCLGPTRRVSTEADAGLLCENALLPMQWEVIPVLLHQDVSEKPGASDAARYRPLGEGRDDDDWRRISLGHLRLGRGDAPCLRGCRALEGLLSRGGGAGTLVLRPHDSHLDGRRGPAVHMHADFLTNLDQQLAAWSQPLARLENHRLGGQIRE